jgi:hypothetical protein
LAVVAAAAASFRAASEPTTLLIQGVWRSQTIICKVCH